MVVRLFYVSKWDIWYRFDKFVVAAYDYDTGEPLFAAGQGHDNMVSNEDVVIKDTFAEFERRWRESRRVTSTPAGSFSVERPYSGNRIRDS